MIDFIHKGSVIASVRLTDNQFVPRIGETVVFSGDVYVVKDITSEIVPGRYFNTFDLADAEITLVLK